MCSREVIKKMLEQKEKETISDYSIINVSSVHELTPSPLSAPYGASIGGMEMLTKTMALEVAGKGIRINGIAPGAISTMMNIDKLQNKKKLEDEEKRIPMHRIGEPSEIGKVALFLASEAASYIQGTTIFVDGGLTLVSKSNGQWPHLIEAFYLNVLTKFFWKRNCYTFFIKLGCTSIGGTLTYSSRPARL
jgi:glucose 1-dehydrogenase